MFIVGLASALPTFGALPLMNQIARFHGVNVLVWAIALTHVILSIGLSFSYGANPTRKSIQIYSYGLFAPRRGIYLHLRRGAQPRLARRYKWPVPAHREPLPRRRARTREFALLAVDGEGVPTRVPCILRARGADVRGAVGCGAAASPTLGCGEVVHPMARGDSAPSYKSHGMCRQNLESGHRPSFQ